MSTTIDQRVVEMRFDNQHFEKNVQTSLSTLDKLKRSLNLTGASKGLENLDSAAKKVDMRGLGAGVETVTAKFSALQVMGITALTNITNSAINAGKRIVKSLTIDPVSTGFNEYELKMNSIQTIMASTGETLDTVNGYLNELNEYSDKTIYSFSDMTQNIGKFTNAGVKLEDAVMAIKGISNEAAVSGANANEASRAMYNFAQALSAGYVKLIDWKSIENANMATVEFKEQLIQAAVAAGTLEKAGDGMYKVLTENNMGSTMDQTISATKNFNDSLNYQWMTTDVLVNTLKDYASETTDIGKKATQAATEVKTFSQMMDSLKESAQSGWAQTWEIIFGDFYEGKSLWTGIYTFVGGIIDKMSDFRNTLLKSALGKSFTKIGDTIKGALKPVNAVADTVKTTTKAISDLGDIVDDVIGGKFGNGKERIDKLTKAGINFYEVQNKVNETLGNNKRYTKEQIEAQNKLLGIQDKATKATSETAKETEELTDAQKKQIKELANMSEEQLRSKGYTEDQIKAFKELSNISKKLGIPIEDLIDNLDKLNGRWILLEGFKNIGESIAKVFGAIRDAWKQTFRAINSDDIFNVIAGFHKFSTSLSISDGTAKKLESTFKGLFAILDLISTITMGGVKVAFTVISKVLDSMGLSILDVTAFLGEAIYKFNEFIENNKLVTAVFDAIADAISWAIDKVKEFFSIFTDNPIFKTISDLFTGIFGDGTEESKAEKISGAINNITNALSDLNSGDKVSVFQRISDGFGAIRTMLNSKWTASLSSGLKILDAFLGLFDTDLSEIIAKIADYAVKVKDWIAENTHLIETNKKIAKVIHMVVTKVVDLAEAFTKLEPVAKVIETIKTAFTKIKEVLSEFRSKVSDVIGSFIELITFLNDKLMNKKITTEEFGEAIVDGIIVGIKAAASAAKEAIIGIGKIIIEAFCELLGIHSPSRVFYEYGKNIVEGLANGIQAVIGLADTAIRSIGNAIKSVFKKLKLDVAFEGLFDSVKTVYTNLVNMLKSFDFKKLLALIPIGIVVIALKKLYDLTKTISDGISGINDLIDGLAGIEKSFSKVLDSYALDIKAKALQKLAISLAILVGAVIALTLVDTSKLYSAVGTIVILGGVLAALAFAMSKLDAAAVKFEKGKGVSFDGLKSGLVSIGAAILMLAAATKLLGDMNAEEFKQSLLGLTVLVAALVTVFTAFGAVSKFGDTSNIDKLGGTLIKLSVALLILVGVCKLIGKLTIDDMAAGAIFMAGFTAFVSLLVMATHFMGNDVDKVGKMVLKLSIAMALLVGVCKLVNLLTTDEMKKGAAFAAGFTVFVAALVVVSKLFPDAEIQKIGRLVLSISVSLMLMVGVCKLVNLLKPEEMIKGAAFVGAFLLFIAGLVKVTKIGKEEQIAKVSATIMAMSIAIGVLAGVCILISMLTPEMLMKGVGAIAVFGTMMALLIQSTRGATDIKGTVMMLAVSIGVLAASVTILSFIPWERLAPAVAGLSLVLGMFALVAKAAGTMQQCMASLIVMTAAIAILSFALYKLAKLPTESLLGTAASLSVLLLSLAASMALIGKFGAVSGTALFGMVILTAVVAALAGIIALLVKVKNIDKAMTAVTALSTLLLSLSAVCVILTVAGLAGPAAIMGVNALIYLITSVGALMLVVGGLVTLVPKLGEFVNNAIPLLQAIGEGLGAFFGGIVKGFSAAVISIIPMLGASLGVFATQIVPFIAVARMVDMDVVKGVGFLALAIGALTAASLISGMANFLSFGTSFAMLGMQLSAFIIGAGPFLAAIKNIDPTSIEAANTLAQMILTLTAADLANSIMSFLGMGTDFSSFGTQLSAFGDAIVAFSNKVSGNINPEAIQAAATAGSIMVELQKSLPKTGGWLQEIAGEQDLAKFGAACVAFGKCIADFNASVSGENAIDPVAAEKAASAGRIMAELQNALPKTGGWLQTIVGEQDLVTFGNSCKAFGKAIKDFNDSVSGENAINPEAATKAAEAGKVMASLQTALPKTGGWLQTIAGEQDLAAFGKSCKAFGEAITDFSTNVQVDEAAVTTAANAGKMLASIQKAIPEDKWLDGKISIDEFGKKIKKFGEHMSSYSEKVSDVNSEAITKSTSAARQLVNIAKSAANIDGDNVDKFSKIKTIGTTIKNYSDKVSGIDSSAVSSSISAANRLRTFINSLAGLDSSGVSSFKSAINSLAKTNVDGLVRSFSGAASKMSKAGINLIDALVKGMRSRQSAANNMARALVDNMYKALISKMNAFMSAGLALMLKLASGMNNAKPKVASAAKSPIVSALTTIRSYYDNYYSAGSYLVTGFANGISANSYKATAKARAMAKAAKQAAEKALGIQSPSKEFYKIGAYVGQGFINALGDYEDKVYSASSTMADSARSGMSNAIGKIIDAFDSDVTQPTIRPVLDLSNVTAGANSISGMFGMRPSVGLLANVNGVSAMMSGYGQNGNDDVVSAIDKLRKAMGNNGGNTYNINGITYDNGSELATAMETIVRHARIERRR